MTPCVAAEIHETHASCSESFCDWSNFVSPRQAEVLAMLNDAFDRTFGADEPQAAYDAA